MSTETWMYLAVTALQLGLVVWLRFQLKESRLREEQAETRAYRESYLVNYYMSNCAMLRRQVARLESERRRH